MTMGNQPPGSGSYPGGYAGLHLRQKITLVSNRYWVHTIDQQGTEGPIVAFAEQKKFKLREEVTFFADESKSSVLFGFKSRQVIDMAATTDVFDAQHNPIGLFRKDAMKSLLNSTWYIEAPGVSATGRERSQGVAIARRVGGLLPGALGNVMDLVPWQFHFDFVDSAGQPIMSVERQRAIRDRYQIWLPPNVHGQPLDWRLAAAVGVALDAFQGR